MLRVLLLLFLRIANTLAAENDSTASSVLGSLPTNCDIHDPTTGTLHSPPSILPQHIGSLLLESRDDIIKSYTAAKAQCMSFLKSESTAAWSGGMAGLIPPAYRKAGDDANDGNGGAYRCRGRRMLHHLAGVTLWPFGPKACPTYRKCWVGVLSCQSADASAKIERLLGDAREHIVKELTKQGRNTTSLPAVRPWTVRAVSVKVRVVGLEIAVPDMRYLSVPSAEGDVAGSEDVLVGQYTLTQPQTSTRVEMRLDELYPSLLHQWDAEEVDAYAFHSLANIYLGGSEDRCRPWTKCTVENFLKECDLAAFVSGTPVAVAVPDGVAACPRVQTLLQTGALPLCPVMQSSAHGRWMLATKGPPGRAVCPEDYFSPVFNDRPKPPTAPAMDATGKRVPQAHAQAQARMPASTASAAADTSSSASSSSRKWFEASGDPCIVKNLDKEDVDEGHWFFAPYTCRYHFYTTAEARKCLKTKQITHIHFHGDSMSRDFFAYASKHLGVSQTSEADLKKMTNDLKQKKLSTWGGDVVLTEGYTWEWDKDVMDMVQTPPVPQVVVSNHYFAHHLGRCAASIPQCMSVLNRTEIAYWKNLKINASRGAVSAVSGLSTHVPQYLLFQSAKDMQGRKRKDLAWCGECMRRNSEKMRRVFSELGFAELNEWELTRGRLSSYGRNDGWHFYGTMKQMESVVFFNMLCNDIQKGT